MVNRQTMFFLLFMFTLALVPGDVGIAKEPAKPASETPVPPEKIVVPFHTGGSLELGVVQKLFAHRRHAIEFKISCGECHHVYEDGKNIWNEGMPIQKCSECHDFPLSKSRKDLAAGTQLRIFLDHPSCARCHRKGEGD